MPALTRQEWNEKMNNEAIFAPGAKRRILPTRLKLLAKIIPLGLAVYVFQAQAEVVRIAVAANFIDAAQAITPLFEKATGHSAKISYGSTGKLYSQIKYGAPFDILLAADSKRPMMAEAVGLAIPGSRFIYAKGKLVLWSPKPNRFTSGEEFLKRGEFSHIALANPRTAPYGQAAEQVLKHLGLQNRLKSKLAWGDSVSQAFQFIATGNAQAGFVAMAQIQAWVGEEGALWIIPANYYDPIEQAAVLLKKGESNPAAIAFLDFLKSDGAREVIKGHGYGVE
jgi:molybdate transport system substrate-binding protein